MRSSPRFLASPHPFLSSVVPGSAPRRPRLSYARFLSTFSTEHAYSQAMPWHFVQLQQVRVAACFRDIAACQLPTFPSPDASDSKPKVFDLSPNILGLSSKMPRRVVPLSAHAPTLPSSSLGSRLESL